MKFFHRMTTMIKADAHGVLDEIETRKLLAKQYLREAQLALEGKQAEVESLEESLRKLVQRKFNLQQQVDRLEEDVELAQKGGKDELARFAMRRLIPHERNLESMTLRQKEITELHAKRLEEFQERRKELETLRERVHNLPDERCYSAAPSAAQVVSDEEVELALLRRSSLSAGGSGR